MLFVAKYGWKGILMNKLENLKMVLFDFDDTLAVHSQGHRISDHLMKYMINVHSGSKELWNTSKPNLQLKKFMDYLACKNISMGLISGVHDCKAAERKIEWVKENYGYSLENYCVSSQEQKMIELSTIAEVNGFHESQIALVDDYYENLGNAGKMLISPDPGWGINLRNKYIFWDIDGTLVEYRFNGHVSDPEGTDNGMSLKEIEDGFFLKRKPSYHMQMVLSTCGAKQNIVMGHCQVQKEMDDKQLWLDKYYPSITERLLVSEDKSKADAILQYCKDHDISLQDVVFVDDVFVDDVIPFLREAERKGIKSFHISSFLDWDFERR